ncbi:MAG: choice-of-anchor D domain-containing protein, partial [Candidatus Kapaibacterium sp.]
MIAGVGARAQTLDLFDIDASTHPIVKAKFYAIDGAGNQNRPTVADLTMTENGVRRTITRVTCPPPMPPKALSSVLVIDVSGSMAQGPGIVPNIELAKVAARAWVNGLPSGESECAITTFNSRNSLNLDFTKDRQRALGAINTLQPGGGTDYDRALILPLAGGLVISRKGINKRVIVMLTDGQPNTEPNVAAIVNEANRQNCIIYCVTLGMAAPQSLFDIASGTGGRVFENITTVEEAQAVYLSILRRVSGMDPCEIEWLSDIACKYESVDFVLQWRGLQSKGRYDIPLSSVASLDVSPTYHRFEKPTIGVPQTQTCTVTARRSPFTVTKIIPSNPAFTLTPTSFALQPDESATLTMTYTATDSSYNYCRFTIENAVCARTFFASGGYRGKKPRDRGLRVVHPNGGETFVVGSDTVILWDGVPPDELVTLEYSIDKGRTWKAVDTARSLTYAWKNVPRPTSRSCLVRASQYTDPNGRLYGSPTVVQKGHIGAAKCLAYSPDGTMLATGGYDGTLRIWNPVSGSLLRTIADQGRPFESVMFSPDNATILASDGICSIREVSTGRVLRTFENNSIPGVCFSPDGGMVASGYVVDTGGVAGSLSLWNAKSGKPIQTLVRRGGIRRVIFSPDGMTMATLGGTNSILQVTLWNAITGEIIHNLYTYDKDVSDASLAYSPDGKTLAFSVKNTVHLVDVYSKQDVITVTSTNGYVRGIAFSRSGNVLAAGCGYFVDLWDVSSGILIRTLDQPNTGIATTAVAISPDGKTLAAAKLDGTIKLWTIDEEPLQQDESDSVFAIVEPLPVAIDVDMKRCLVGTSKDSVVKGLVGNVGTYPFTVRRITFSGADAAAFSLVSGLPEYSVAPGSSRIGELRFQPQRVGLHQAQIVIETQSEVLTRSIRGVGLAPTLEVVCPIVDFGRIAIGTSRDSLRVAGIRNTGTEPITITGARHAGPNAVDFSTQSGGGSFVLKPGETRLMNLRFTPSDLGRTSGAIEFSYDGLGSPAIMQLFGDAYDSCTAVQRTVTME